MPADKKVVRENADTRRAHIVTEFGVSLRALDGRAKLSRLRCVEARAARKIDQSHRAIGEPLFHFAPPRLWGVEFHTMCVLLTHAQFHS